MGNNQDSTLGPLARRMQQLLHIGAEHAADATLRRKVMQCNTGMWLTVGNIIAFNLMFAWSGNEGLIRSGLFQLPIGLLLIVSVTWLNGRGRLSIARWVLAALVAIDITVGIVLGQGTLLNLHLYFIVVAAVATVFFPPLLWRQAVLASAINIALFAWFELRGWEPHPAMLEMSPSDLYAFRTVMLTSCVVIVVVLMLFSEYSAARNELELQAMANTDSLTHLPNRRAFRARLARDLATSHRSGSLLTVVIIDIDFFKDVNDAHGHDAGDLVLQGVGQVLQQQLRPDDMLARMGGEEFAVLMPSLSVEHGRAVAERMRQAVESHRFETPQTSLQLTVSLGVAALPPGARADSGLKSADAALYAAKQAGRNQVQVGIQA